MTEAGTGDLTLIADLAERIWWAVYPPIIGADQVRYMLERMYAAEALQRDRANGVVFMLVREHAIGGDDGLPIGFYALDLAQAPERAFLDKLYLLPERHGHGIGQRMLASACRLACEQGHSGVMLRVNRHNESAIRAYRRFGFREWDRVCSDIGGGFVMDDIRFVWGCEDDKRETEADA